MGHCRRCYSSAWGKHAQPWHRLQHDSRRVRSACPAALPHSSKHQGWSGDHSPHDPGPGFEVQGTARASCYADRGMHSQWSWPCHVSVASLRAGISSGGRVSRTRSQLSYGHGRVGSWRCVRLWPYFYAQKASSSKSVGQTRHLR